MKGDWRAKFIHSQPAAPVDLRSLATLALTFPTFFVT
jgi:hypothetical protein